MKLFKPEATFFERHPAAARNTDNVMVEDVNVQEFSGFAKLFGHKDV